MTRQLTLGLILIGLALAACGGGSPAEQRVKLSFDAVDALFYEPGQASVPAGATVDVTFINKGTLDHNWVLVADNADMNDTDLANKALGGATSGLQDGGATANFTFIAPAAGTYKFVCSVLGHAPAGMVGTLTVTP